jgi:hypothetical protein
MITDNNTLNAGIGEVGVTDVRDARASHHYAFICAYLWFLWQQLVGLSDVKLG